MSPSSRTLGVALAVVVVASVAVVGGTYIAGSGSNAPPQTAGPAAPTETDADARNRAGTDGAPGEETADTDRQTAPADRSEADGWSYTTTADLPPLDASMTIPESPTVRDVANLNRTEVTVVTTQGYYPDDEVADLVAFTTDGTVIFHEAKYGVYFDVDPVPGTKFTVEYLASKHFNRSGVCDPVPAKKCTRDVLRRVNLTTGEARTVYSEVTPRYYSARQHDADRINDTHIVMAGIVHDRVYVVNTTSDEVTWQWNASYDFSEKSGGKWFDWTHLNDVEVLPDGRFMATLRNQDSVVFLDPEKPPKQALQESWTLGSDDKHSILYEQHNPDYIPKSRGGPAVVVGDSENNRAVEYRRVDGDWKRTWTWKHEGVKWVRDADRLPNGNTLVVNSRGDSVIGVGPDDEIRWQVEIGMPYDVERLGTGDESAGGMVASRRDEAAKRSRLAGGAADVNPSSPGTAPVLLAVRYGAALVGLLALVALAAVYRRRAMRPLGKAQDSRHDTPGPR